MSKYLIEVHPSIHRDIESSVTFECLPERAGGHNETRGTLLTDHCGHLSAGVVHAEQLTHMQGTFLALKSTGTFLKYTISYWTLYGHVERLTHMKGTLLALRN